MTIEELSAAECEEFLSRATAFKLRRSVAAGQCASRRSPNSINTHAFNAGEWAGTRLTHDDGRNAMHAIGAHDSLD